MQLNQNNKVIFLCLVIGSFSLQNFLSAQTEDWKRETTKDGNTEVLYYISNRIDHKGKEVILIQYKAITTADVSLESCARVLQDVSMHKEFLEDTEVSDEIEAYTDKDCLIYYFFNARWPMPNSDCVVDMKYIVDSTNNMLRFETTASPQKLEMKDVKRLNHFSMSYSFKQLKNGKVEVELYSELTPVISAPKWMAKFWFPEGPAGIVERIIQLAREID